jgi:hypothetical protein
MVLEKADTHPAFMKILRSLPVLAGMLVAGSSLAVLPGSAQAVPLLSGFGGPKGFGTNSVFRNDDQGVGPIALPFAINFYGTTYNNYYANTNGNITFQSVFGTFTPSFFPGAPQPIIAPWWADVDTRNPSSGDEGLVWYTNPDANTTVVTWNNVGVYNQLNPPTTNVQLVVRNLAPSTGTAGDFSFEFRYDDLNWTTGQASGGNSQGLGGTPALAGFDAGNSTDFFTIPGSKTADVLNLVNTSNVGESGVWRFNVSSGEVVIPPGPAPTSSVPGPLPLLGVGATLAWSRRLRKRISASV